MKKFSAAFLVLPVLISFSGANAAQAKGPSFYETPPRSDRKTAAKVAICARDIIQLQPLGISKPSLAAALMMEDTRNLVRDAVTKPASEMKKILARAEVILDECNDLLKSAQENPSTPDLIENPYTRRSQETLTRFEQLPPEVIAQWPLIQGETSLSLEVALLVKRFQTQTTDQATYRCKIRGPQVAVAVGIGAKVGLDAGTCVGADFKRSVVAAANSGILLGLGASVGITVPYGGFIVESDDDFFTQSYPIVGGGLIKTLESEIIATPENGDMPATSGLGIGLYIGFLGRMGGRVFKAGNAWNSLYFHLIRTIPDSEKEGYFPHQPAIH
jgi:hypothetical protein